MDDESLQHRFIEYTGLLLFVLGAVTMLNSPLYYLDLKAGATVGGFLVIAGLASMGYCKACKFTDQYLG